MNAILKAAAAAVAAVLAGLAGAGNNAAPAAPSGSDLCKPGLAQIIGLPGPDGRPTYIACVRVAEQPLSGARVDLRYSAAVSQTTATDTIVVCWGDRAWTQIGQITKQTLGASMAHTGGFVWDGQQVANLPGRLCRYLDAVTYRHSRAINRSVAWAFKNLTHEAIHVAGVTNEAATECYAIQLMAQTFSNLGLGRRYGERVARLSWSRYPRMRKIGPIYWTQKCQNDGPLDLRPGNARWPS
jgi:hypothetical protein